MLTQEEETFKSRLTELRDLLLTVPAKQFKFTSWVGLDWGGKPDLSCGTTACGFGWATTIPSLRDLGLGLYRSKGGFVTVAMSQEAVTENASTAAEKAGEEVFGLSPQEFNYLFIPREDYDDFGVFNEEDGDEYVDENSELSDELAWQYETFGRFACSRTASAKELAENITHFIFIKYG